VLTYVLMAHTALAPIMLFVSLALLVWAGALKLMQGSDPDQAAASAAVDPTRKSS
jgi:hypothetical protein